MNTFTEKTFTPAHREMTESLNRDTFDQLVQGIATARKKTPEEVRALIDQGPFNPEDALSAGLVDDLAYLDEVDDKAGLGDLTRTELDDYTRAAGQRPALRPRRSHRGDLRGRHDQLGPQRRRPGRHVRRIGHAGRIHPGRARGSVDQGGGAARRQPGRIVGRLRRHLARADAPPRREAARSSRCPISRRPAATTSPWPATSSSPSPAR